MFGTEFSVTKNKKLTCVSDPNNPKFVLGAVAAVPFCSVVTLRCRVDSFIMKMKKA